MRMTRSEWMPAWMLAEHILTIRSSFIGHGLPDHGFVPWVDVDGSVRTDHAPLPELRDLAVDGQTVAVGIALKIGGYVRDDVRTVADQVVVDVVLIHSPSSGIHVSSRISRKTIP